eukprot:Gb_27044 [translate_table: standard]
MAKRGARGRMAATSREFEAPRRREEELEEEDRRIRQEEKLQKMLKGLLKGMSKGKKEVEKVQESVKRLLEEPKRGQSEKEPVEVEESVERIPNEPVEGQGEKEPYGVPCKETVERLPEELASGALGELDIQGVDNIDEDEDGDGDEVMDNLRMSHKKETLDVNVLVHEADSCDENHQIDDRVAKDMKLAHTEFACGDSVDESIGKHCSNAMGHIELYLLQGPDEWRQVDEQLRSFVDGRRMTNVPDEVNFEMEEFNEGRWEAGRLRATDVVRKTEGRAAAQSEEQRLGNGLRGDRKTLMLRKEVWTKCSLEKTEVAMQLRIYEHEGLSEEELFKTRLWWLGEVVRQRLSRGIEEWRKRVEAICRH